MVRLAASAVRCGDGGRGDDDMTTPDAALLDDPDEVDDLAEWQAEPSTAHPHVALLLGGSVLIVLLACVAPLFVVGDVRPGMPTGVLLLAVAVAALAGLAPFVSPRLRDLRYITGVLVVLDLLPLVLAATVAEHTPERRWSAVLLIPVLIAAATLGSRLYAAELVAGCAVGVVLMAHWAPDGREAVLTAVGSTFFLVVCASVTRSDRTALDLRYRQWLRRSRRDAMTGLLNRRGLVAAFPAVRQDCLDAGVPLGVVMMDIDHFSRINAEHGHGHGDRVLRALCARVGELPEVAEGIVARIGGEELVVMVPRPAADTAEALRAALHRDPPHPGLTVSMGICDADPAGCADTEAMWRLVHDTDTAMYRAKQLGRDRVERVDPGGGAGATGTATRPEPPRWGPRPMGAAAAEVAVPGRSAGPSPQDATDDRIFGAYCVAFAAIGAVALAIPVAVDPHTAWAWVFGAGLVLMAALGVVAVVRRRPSPMLLTGSMCVVTEVATLAAVLATPDLEHRLLVVCVLTVPVLVSAHAMPLPWLGGQSLLVGVGVGLAATGPGEPVGAEWMHRTLSQAALLCAAPGVLFWLRRRREEANARLRRLASVDPLTGVHNRDGLELGAAALGERPLRVMTLNVVGFKALNDTFGHVFGDEVLVHLGRALAHAVGTTSAAGDAGRPAPVIGRTGGDRFVVVGADPFDPALTGRVVRSLQTFPPEVVVATGEAAGTVHTTAELWALVAAAEAAAVRPTPRRAGPGGLTTGRRRP